MVPQFRPIRIKEIRKETAECVSISFDVPEQWKQEFRFRHGQNITIKSTFDGEEIRRSYSICSSPLENELRVAVKQVTAGRFSNFANQALKKGDVLEVLPPTGTFSPELDPALAKNYVAFAAGSGITPIISIIKTALAVEPRSTFTLVFGNRTRHSIIFREALEGLKNQYMSRFTIHHILTREKTDAPINSGRINADKCRELSRLIDFKDYDAFFICGPEEMIFQVKAFLELEGISSRKIHFELFTVPGQTKASANKDLAAGIQHAHEGKKSLITIKLDGSSFDFELSYESSSILDAALKMGADLPYACKGGVCSSCRGKLTTGIVEMDANYALEPDELEAGFILTCQSHPRSEKVIVDFDLK